ncbi:hypothetical protein FRC03_010932 [Tulasnella sp. 419]|nr:hypothetical protein FRC03_010932 [Tulasnella sp. 419]
MKSQSFASKSRLLSTLGLPGAVSTALENAGYESLGDLEGLSEVQLLQELGLNGPLPLVLLPHLTGEPIRQDLAPSDPSVAVSDLVSSQSIGKAGSSLNPRPYTTPSIAINTLLAQGARPLKLKDGGAPATTILGLRPQSILEIAGPPGSGKRSLALEFVRSALSDDQHVLILDIQSFMDPSRLRQALEDLRQTSTPSNPPYLSPLEGIYYANTDDIVYFIAFLQRLPLFLESHPKISLLVFSALSAVLCSGDYGHRNRITELTKNALTKACMQHGITVVITSHTATRMIGSDGLHATFDTGSHATIVSQLGNVLEIVS